MMGRTSNLSGGEIMGSSGLQRTGGMMNMMDGGFMGGTGMFLGGLFGLVWFALGSFIFSIIFWLTRNWLIKNKRR